MTSVPPPRRPGSDTRQGDRRATDLSDAAWAVALVREAASARFAVRAVPPPANTSDPRSNPGRHQTVMDGTRDLARAQPTVR